MLRGLANIGLLAPIYFVELFHHYHGASVVGVFGQQSGMEASQVVGPVLAGAHLHTRQLGLSSVPYESHVQQQAETEAVSA